VLRLKAAESFLETSQCTYFIEKSGLRDVKRADFIRYWRRSGLTNPDKPKIFIKKNERNHSYHQFYLVLAKIRINRGLLYLDAVCVTQAYFARVCEIFIAVVSELSLCRHTYHIGAVCLFCFFKHR